MKNVYITPEVSVCTLSKNDILNGSDVIIDGSGLFDEAND